jgi:putative acetyltransferase
MEKSIIDIRLESAADIAAIHTVETSAFGRSDEADLVDALRRAGCEFISLVAVVGGEIVGHICFSSVVIEGADGDSILLALAPLAVSPPHQSKGIGSALVREGLRECLQRNVDAVFVVGHPAYYPRFGFRPASSRGVKCEFEVPDAAFMAVELRSEALDDHRGVLRYPPPFHLMH